MYKISETANKFLSKGDKFLLEMNLKQSKFAYSASGPFKKRNGKKNLKKQEIHDIFIKMS